MDLNNIFRYLNLDKSSKQKVISSHPLLKKYFSNTTSRRKPKRLDSLLAKKLEDVRHRLTEQYFSLKDIYKILEIEEFDGLRKQSYLVAYEKIQKTIEDLEDKNYQLSRLYAQIKQDIKYFTGEEEKESVEGLTIEDQIQQRIILGSKEFKK